MSINDVHLCPGNQIFNFASTDEIEYWVNTLKMVPPITIRNNICFGVNEDNVYNYWFHKTIFKKIQDNFGYDLKLMFGMFLDETVPWGVHTDSYHTDPYPLRQPAISFLIPYSVDYDTSQCDKSHTIVFNEQLTDNKKLLTLPDISFQDNSAVKVYDSMLSHNNLDCVKRLSIFKIFKWQPTSLIYWSSTMLHDSDNFHKNGFQTKQAIVIHTYREN
jgi:hypothetical protein